MSAKVRVMRSVILSCDKCRNEGPHFGMARRDTLKARLAYLSRFYKPGSIGLFGDNGTKIGSAGAWLCASCKPNGRR